MAAALTTGYPYLAIASLIVSVWVALGSVPRILLIWAALCFLPIILSIHWTQLRTRLNPKLNLQESGKAGIIISCSALAILLISSGALAVVHYYSRPLIIVRESPAELDALRPRIVDEVLTGIPPSEQDHKIDGKNIMAGPFNGKNWRSAVVGGWMSYVMKVLPDQPMSLNCRYWGTEQAGRTFDILIDGEVIATQNLEFNVPGHFFDAEYKIPVRLTRGKTHVTVKFQAHPGLAAGGLFGCQTLKR